MKLWDFVMLKLKTSFESLKSDYESHVADGHPFESDLPVGAIIMWFSEDIPSGWALCDGTNGSPNLSYKFFYGSMFADQVGDTYTIASGNNHVYTVIYINFIIKL